MALPIAPTPALKAKDWKKFLKRVKEQESIPSYLVLTPRLKRAVELIRKKAKKGMP